MKQGGFHSAHQTTNCVTDKLVLRHSKDFSAVINRALAMPGFDEAGCK